MRWCTTFLICANWLIVGADRHEMSEFAREVTDGSEEMDVDANNHSHISYGFGHCSGMMDELAECEETACVQEECIDCEWGEWSEYDSCSCEGLQERYRTIKTKNTACGTPCRGIRVETKSCTPTCFKLAVDCVLGEWAAPMRCDKDCGGGQTYRERTIIKEAEFGGKPCEGLLKESFTCNNHPCYAPENCDFRPWGEWSSCSATCAGTKRRERALIPGKHGGRGCKGVMTETLACGSYLCGHKRDCEWHDWAEWSSCTATCGGGQHSRSRSIKVAPQWGGAQCEAKPLNVVELCHTKPCEEKENCVFGPWSAWDACTCTCNGLQHRVRNVATFSRKGGKACEGNLREVQGCNVGVKNCDALVTPRASTTTTSTSTPVRTTTVEPLRVPIDCTLGEWTAWGNCSSHCGGGVRTRGRRVVEEPSPRGKPCDAVLQVVESCNEKKCHTFKAAIPASVEPVDCILSEWSPWGLCSATCGGGEYTRTRHITQEPNSVGTPCAHQAFFEVASCNTHGCACVDCRWGEWSGWSECTCTGLQERHRVVAQHYSSCGAQCDGPKTETQRCARSCTVKQDCLMGEWSAWGKCSQTCGAGNHKRERAVIRDALGGGKGCTGNLEDVGPCNERRCGHPTDCTASSWSEWQQCSVSCGGGVQLRTRSIAQHAHDGGALCDNALQEIRGCNSMGCHVPVDCYWGEWSEYSACSASCGGGHRDRDRSIMIAPKYGGKLCEAKSTSETVPCNTHACDDVLCVDAQWGAFGDWSECSASCGESYRVRSRRVDVTANHCGKPLEGNMQEFEPCEHVACNHLILDCEFSQWSEWGDCSCSCNGVHDRSRRIKAYDQHSGKACQGPLKQLGPCNMDVCNVTPSEDCRLSEWEPWSRCNADCGGGQQTRSRELVQYSAHNGKPCEATLVEMQGCNTQECEHPVDCKWSQWNEWSACSHKCNGGNRNRFRHIVKMAKRDGKPCDPGASAEMGRCNTEPCDTRYCAWGTWAQWSRCSRTCGRGQKKRERKLRVAVEKPNDDDLLFAGALDQENDLEAGKLVRTHVGSFAGVLLGGFLFASMVLAFYSRVRQRTGFHLLESTTS